MTTHISLKQHWRSGEWLAYLENEQTTPISKPDVKPPVAWRWPTMEKAAGDLIRLFGTGMVTFRYLDESNVWRKWP